ncbi:polyprenyl synthetase family protein, partial [Rhizobium leguminosarum]
MEANPDTFETRRKNNASDIEALIDALLSPSALYDEIARPERLRDA